jgi:hypothetical protein
VPAPGEEAVTLEVIETLAPAIDEAGTEIDVDEPDLRTLNVPLVNEIL